MDYKLIPWNDPMLKCPLAEMDLEKENLEELSLMMIEQCKKMNGVGLSANQIGIEKRMFAIAAKDYEKVFFNPKIRSYSKEKVLMEEGCLSRPGLWLAVSRPESIIVDYTDVDGRQVSQEMRGVLARIFQHEYDHMEGVDFTERVSALKLARGKKKQEKTREKLMKKLVQQRSVIVPKPISAVAS